MVSDSGAVNIVSINGVQDPTQLDRPSRDLISRRESVFGPGYRLFYSRPVRPVRALGTKIFDASGEVLLDAYNNVPCIGHGHPRVVTAMAEQLAMVNTNTRYLQDTVVDYGERLLRTMHPSLDRVMFTNSGSEANDLAVRMAEHITGHTGLIVSNLAYHGTTALVAGFSPGTGARIALGQHVRTVPPPDPELSPGRDPGVVFAENVAAAISDLHRHGVGLAALVVDGMFSSDGIYPAREGLLNLAVHAVHAAGGLFILDEVQTGFARTGSMWGYQAFGAQPDIVTLGKPMANGLPVAGVVAEWDLLEEFGSQVPFFSTFGGATACIAAADAVLSVIQDEGIIDNVRRQGATMREGIRAVSARAGHSFVVRGEGLYLGVQISSPRLRQPAWGVASAIVNEMREKGVLISLAAPDTLKIRPPLVFDSSDADQFLTTFDDVVRRVAS